MVERAKGMGRKWLSQWRRYRLNSEVTGYADNKKAAKLGQAQKEELEETFNKPPSEAGAKAEFWDVPTLKDVASISFGVDYEPDSSRQPLLRFLGMIPLLPDPLERCRDEKTITKRMVEIRSQGAGLLHNCFCSSTRFVSSMMPKPGGCGFTKGRK